MTNKTSSLRTGLLLGLGTIALTGCGLLQPSKVGQTAGKEFTVTVKNTLPKERFAPVLIVGDANDRKIWVGDYVSPEARTQFTTGNPGPLAAVLGGDQGQPGKVGVGEEITFTFKTTARKARITAMVHPDITPDNYVTALIDLNKPGVTPLERFDIGDDEKRMTVLKVGPAGTVTLK
ncbi:MAG: hypothetical protein ABJA77_16675 [Variovorax sp.]